MKEFVEKLIEQLEEYIEEYSETDKNGLHSERWCAMQEAKMVVNQLAEEYNPSKSKSLEKGWVPCIERLPDSGVDVNITTRSSIVGVGSFFEKTNEWVQWYCGGGIVVDVIAWQPLPSPYKPEEKTEKPQTNFYAEMFNRVI